MASTRRFSTDDGREVRFVAAEFPGDEEFVLSGARRVANKADTYIDEEQLVRDLHSGRYWCFRIVVDDVCVGGSVLEAVKKRNGEELIHIYLVWGREVVRWLSAALAAAKALADETGCVGVSMESARWGWIKLLPTGRLSWKLEI